MTDGRRIVQVGEDEVTDPEAVPSRKDRHLGRLVSTRLGPHLYEELKYRAERERRSITRFLECWIEKTFEKHPLKREPRTVISVGERPTVTRRKRVSDDTKS